MVFSLWKVLVHGDQKRDQSSVSARDLLIGADHLSFGLPCSSVHTKLLLVSCVVGAQVTCTLISPTLSPVFSCSSDAFSHLLLVRSSGYRADAGGMFHSLKLQTLTISSRRIPAVFCFPLIEFSSRFHELKVDVV